MKVFKNLFTIFLLSTYFKGILGSHILFLHTCVSYSHRVSSWPLIEALVQKGHQVTFIGPFPSKIHNPKVTDIVPKALNKYINEVINDNFDVTHRAYGLTPKFVMVYDLLCYQACSELLRSEEFKAWLKTDPKIDLIYSDTVSECAYGLVSKLKTKHAITLPLTFISKHFDMYGIPPETSTIPDWDVTFKAPLTFWGRSVGAVIPLLWRASQLIYYHWYASLFHEHLGLENVPCLDEMQAVTSLILINGDFIEDYPRSYPPFVVKVPGMHDIETFISKEGTSRSQGFIYISFGTVAKAPNLPLEIRRVFFNAIQAFPHLRFIWRWDGPIPKEDTIPDNLLLKKWVEQEDLLGHPKIRGFITQAGRPSMMEAFYNGVPTITFPILAEQDFNAHRYEMLGVSINLDIVGIKEETLKHAISQLTENSTYSNKVESLQKFARDTHSNSPVTEAVWWTEYCLRHDQKHLSLLRPTTQNLWWFQKRDLDVWLFFALLGYIGIRLSSLFCRFIVNAMFFKGKEKLS